jgi:LppX_LprAFG lipoprotein
VARRGLIALAISAAALSTAACGGGGGASGLPSVAGAATKTAGAKSLRFHMDLRETVGPVGPLDIVGDGVSDNSTHSADMTINLSAVATLAGAQGVSPDQWTARMILDGTGASPLLYIRMPALNQYLSGKAWVRADLGALAKKGGLSQLLQTAGNEDPTKALQLLSAVGNVTKVGTATVDGVNATEYTGSIDVKKAAAAVGSSYGKLLRQSKDTKIPIDVWVGSDGLVRRLRENFSYPVDGTPSTTSLTLSLTDFGVKATITPPAADKTVDFSKLKALGG